MTRWLAVALIALTIAGCTPGYRPPPEDQTASPARGGDGGGGGGGSM